jgi:hypothetical protein
VTDTPATLAAARADAERKANALARAFALFEAARERVRDLETQAAASETLGQHWIPLAAAAERACRSVDAVRLWAMEEPRLGRKVRGRWFVNSVVLRQIIAGPTRE